MDILGRIDQIRREQNLSVYELAKKCDIARNTIYNWYSKNYLPSIETLEIICNKGFNISLAQFFALDSELMPIIDKETKEIFEKYSLLSETQKEAVKNIIFSYSNK